MPKSAARKAAKKKGSSSSGRLSSGVVRADKRHAMYIGTHEREVDTTPWRIDRFRAFVSSGVNSFVGSGGQPHFERVIDPRDPEAVAAQKALLDMIDHHLRVYSIEPALLAATMAEADRVLMEEVGLPPWPAMPLWVEWPGAYLGDDPDQFAGFTIGAILVGPELRHERRPDGTTRPVLITTVTLIGIDNTQKALLFFPDGTWATQATAPCIHPTCTIAARTRTKPGTNFHTREQADSFEALSCACVCWYHGRNWVRILWAMMHLLTAKGVRFEDVDRYMPIPTRPKNATPKQLRSWQSSVNRIQAANRSYPPITRITWDDLTHAGGRVQRVRDADGTMALLYLEGEEAKPERPVQPLGEGAEVREGVVRRAHPRLLIADGKRRWLPPTRVVPVQRSKPYAMRVHRASGLAPVCLMVEGAPHPASPVPPPLQPVVDEVAEVTPEQFERAARVLKPPAHGGE